MGDVVVDPDSEEVRRLLQQRVVKDRLRQGQGEPLRPKAPPAADADDLDLRVEEQRRGQRSAERARLLHLVMNADLLDRLLERSKEVLRAQRAVQVDRDDADPLPFLSQSTDSSVTGRPAPLTTTRFVNSTPEYSKI